MKKSLLVAALAVGFAGVAHAESSVTLYGLVDLGFGYEQTKTSVGDEVTKVRKVGARQNVKNSSRWGLKGSEDLGNGTSAIFQLEGGFRPVTGESTQGGALFGRKAIVGLTGESWGTFTIGRQYNLADDFIAGIDPFGTSFGQATAESTFGASISARQTPTIKYLSPSFDGFKFGVAVISSDTKTTTTTATTKTVEKTKTNGFSFGLGYNNGPVELGVAFDYNRNKKELNGKTDSDSKAKSWIVAGAYDFDVVKLHLGYGQQRDGIVLNANDTFGESSLLDATESVVKEVGFTNTKGLRTQAWFAGLTAPVGEAGKVIFGYQGGRIKHKATMFENKATQFDGVRVNTHVYSLGYQHNLSKRTHLYAIASYGQAKAKNYKAGGTSNVKLKARSTDFAVGLQHRF
ncbi:porin [Pelistega sp. NLN82]|uniref:Porin n=1 Tax=Pelistega ratti TaxID=2652177 RepID=A0A6L9Y6N4_9BURK|nr:porin [Pelistega ratti]NEN76130.1 porin [Pelistega ratti]